jgi:hypothetical protein
MVRVGQDIEMRASVIVVHDGINSPETCRIAAQEPRRAEPLFYGVPPCKGNVSGFHDRFINFTAVDKATYRVGDLAREKVFRFINSEAFKGGSADLVREAKSELFKSDLLVVHGRILPQIAR